VSSKLGAQVILRGLLDLPIDLDAISDPIEEYDPEMDTIVEASEVPGMAGIEIERY
jgi:DEAD/DEAH box helicase domain-containing protein